jgi:hypothetical protein
VANLASFCFSDAFDPWNQLHPTQGIKNRFEKDKLQELQKGCVKKLS